MYKIYTSQEHCHRCGTFSDCVVRLNEIRPEETKKTALCASCALKEQKKD